MLKQTIKINQLRDLYAKAIYRAVSDSKGYKYLLFNKDSKLQNDGNDITVDDVTWLKLTLKVRNVIDMWIRLGMVKKETAQIPVEEDLVKATYFDIPTGNVGNVINFSGLIGITAELAKVGLVIQQITYAFETGAELETIQELFNGMPNIDNKYASELLPAIEPTTLSAYYKSINQYVKFSVEKYSNKHYGVADLGGFKDGKFVYLIPGLATKTVSEEMVDIMNIGNCFKGKAEEIADDIKLISTTTKLDWLATSFKEGQATKSVKQEN